SFDYNQLYNFASGGHSDYSLRWLKPGDEAYKIVPALPEGPPDSRDLIYSQSDILVTKGDHIRLQDFRIGYDLNKNNFKQFPFQSIQIFFLCNNIGIIWKANKHGIDPEAYSFGSMPAQRMVSLGVQLTH